MNGPVNGGFRMTSRSFAATKRRKLARHAEQIARAQVGRESTLLVEDVRDAIANARLRMECLDWELVGVRPDGAVLRKPWRDGGMHVLTIGVAS